jgi:hypothetical protein
MHAKYEVMHWAVMENPFRTHYFCWLDVGLFRDLDPEGPRFSLYLPEGFQQNSVAYQLVHDRDIAATAEEIVRKNLFWVCGGFFIGTARTIYLWTAEYRVSGLTRMNFRSSFILSRELSLNLTFIATFPILCVVFPEQLEAACGITACVRS